MDKVLVVGIGNLVAGNTYDGELTNGLVCECVSLSSWQLILLSWRGAEMVTSRDNNATCKSSCCQQGTGGRPAYRSDQVTLTTVT